MKNFRFLTAISVCKLLRLFFRIFHRGGTAFPGRVAMAICPELLSRLAEDVKTVAVTGTNGKTTSVRMIEQAFVLDNRRCFSNRSGANVLSGITTEFVMHCSFNGKMKEEYAVIECDEAWTSGSFSGLQPRVILVTNLFPDRGNDVNRTLNFIRKGIQKVPEAAVILNADCPLTASLASDLPNRIVYFGMKGSVFSAESMTEFSKEHCCSDGKSVRDPLDYAVVSVLQKTPDATKVMMNIKGQELPVRVNLPAVYNVCNAAGAIAACVETGIDKDTAIKAAGCFQCGFGRMEHFSLGKNGAVMVLVKNPVGFSRVIDFLQEEPGNFSLVIGLNSRTADGKNPSWIREIDLTGLKQMENRIRSIRLFGDNVADIRECILRAGISPEKILSGGSVKQIAQQIGKEEEKVYILPNYTAMLELRRQMIALCGGVDFWKQ